MSSQKDKFKGFRPYFKEEDKKTSPELKEISIMPSTIETIDFAVNDWINETLDIYCTTNEGWKKVPIIWSMPERAFQVKDNKDLRNSKNTFTLPVLTIERTSLIKDPTMKGVAWSHIPQINDPRGGAITVARRIQQDKTRNFANADSQRRFGQQNFPFQNNKVVYETLTMPVPTYVVANYVVTVHTEYQQQMNEIFTPFITTTGQINNFFIHRDGHKFEGFIENDFTLDNNLSNLGEEERKFQTIINLKILGYLLGAGKNDNRPKISIRENAVEVRIPRERVIMGDEREND
jgi:hypothetical protein